MQAMFIFRVEKTGFAGGMRDLHIDGRSLADYGVIIDSWLNARFSNLEANNFRQAFVQISSDQHGDSAGHVFDQVWVRDDISTRPIGSRFAQLRAGKTGKVTDTAFRDCAVTAGTAFISPSLFLWELSDTTRVLLERCRVSTTKEFTGSILIAQEPAAPRGALVHDKNSGHNIVRDFYHEQVGSSGAIGVMIDGARHAAGQLQRGNVVENINMQPSRATAVWLRNTGHIGNTVDNRILLPQRTATYSRTVVVGPGVTHTRIWVMGGDNSIRVGPSEADTIEDRGRKTWVNGQLAVSSARANDRPDPAVLGANVGDTIHNTNDGRVYVVTRSGRAVQVNAGTSRQRVYAWLTPQSRNVSLGFLPEHSWVVQPVTADIVEPFSGSREVTIEIGTADDPDRFGILGGLSHQGVTPAAAGGAGGYNAGRIEVIARVSGSTDQPSATGRALVLVEYYEVGSPQ